MKFSIIIATMNGATLIQRAIVSVLTQVWPDYEIIVQDGGSTDGTIDIVKQFKSRVAWVSEPDTGVYDAWNKALDRASGDWALFLGDDDFLLDKEVLAKCQVYLGKLPPEVSFAYGGLVVGKQGTVSYVLERSLPAVYHTFLSDMGLPFPATFIRVPLLKEHRFDAGFKIAGDFDFAARLVSPSNVAQLPLRVSYMETGGLSTNPKFGRTLLAERLRVLRTHIRPKAGELVGALADTTEKEAAERCL